MEQQLKFRHTLPIQLRFNDIDRFGHVNNSVYFNYYDLGKVDYFASAYPALDLSSYAVLLVHLDVDFFSQVFASESIAVQTAVSKIGNKSLTLVQQIINTETREVKCVCKSILVAFDLQEQTSIEIPQDWKEAISAYEAFSV